ncbi:hypothetical protein Pcaca02_36400 [Pectobacterium carotovorum subsp. carotovorum]|nr:hypothetical protein Pcaca02_36400 [Pectobacterium carotovorum subsp. carotovorum]
MKIIKKKQFDCYVNDRYKKIRCIQKDTRLCKFILFTKNLHFLPKKLLTACSEAKFIYLYKDTVTTTTKHTGLAAKES